jgi:pyruvate-formate lyase-activating enzyme
MGTQQYRLQQEKLQELAQFLASFNYDIQSKLNEYKQRVQYMYETGLPEETKLRFEMEHIMETESLVNTISNLIEERSIPFTNQNIELMENLIALNS